MDRPSPDESGRFWADLMRRRVVRVAAAYIAIALASLEGADMILPRLGLPDRILTFLVILVVVGFPVAMGLAWFLQIVPDAGSDSVPADDSAAIAEHTPARPVRIAALGVATAVFAGIAAFWIPRTPAFQGGDTDPAALVVLPFEVRGDAETAYLREGMVDLLSTKLDGVGDLRVVDPHATMARVGEAPLGSITADQARAIAAGLDAGRVLQGSVVLAGPSLQIRATVHGPGAGETIDASVEGSADGLFALVDELVRELISAGLVAGDVHLASLEGLTTHSNQALRLYLDGVRNFREGGGTDETYGVLTEAVELDSTFALASYWAGYVAVFFDADDPLPHFERAARHQERLSQRDRLLLSAALAEAQGQVGEALRLYTTVVERYPDDVAGWFQLAELLAHRGRYGGRTLAEARPAYERAITLDPGLAPAYYHLSHIGSLQGDTTALAAWANGLEAATPDTLQLSILRFMRSLLVGDGTESRRWFELVRMGELDIPAATMAGSMGQLLGASLEHVPVPSLEYLHEFGDRAVTDTALVVTARRSARAEAGVARFDDARRTLEEVGDRLGTLLAQDLAWIALHPLNDRPGAAETASARLASLELAAGTGEAVARDYLLGRLALALGRDEEFSRAIRALAVSERETDPRDLEIGQFARDLGLDLEARAEWSAGRPDAALERLLQASFWERPQPWPGVPTGTYFEGALPDRDPMYFRAQLLDAAGQDSVAALWYEIAAEGAWYRRPALEALSKIGRRPAAN